MQERYPWDKIDRDGSGYWPVANVGLVRPIAAHDEYRRILPYRSDSLVDETQRQLYIINDSSIELGDQAVELLGDARFVFNALLASARSRKTALEIINFEHGFREQGPYATSNSLITTPFMRAVNALDAFTMSASDDIMIQREHWGAGGRQPWYEIKSDIAVIDTRTSVQ